MVCTFGRSTHPYPGAQNMCALDHLRSDMCCNYAQEVAQSEEWSWPQSCWFAGAIWPHHSLGSIMSWRENSMPTCVPATDYNPNLQCNVVTYTRIDPISAKAWNAKQKMSYKHSKRHFLSWSKLKKLHSQTHIFCTNKSTHQPERERETFPFTNLICLSCTSIKVEIGIVLVEGIIRQVHAACSQITWVWLLVPLSAKPHYSLSTKRKVQLWVSSVICIDASQFPPATPLKIVVKKPDVSLCYKLKLAKWVSLELGVLREEFHSPIRCSWQKQSQIKPTCAN